MNGYPFLVPLDSTSNKRERCEVVDGIPPPSGMDLQVEMSDHSQDILQVDDFSTISNAIIKLPLQWISAKLPEKKGLALLQMNDLYMYAKKRIILDTDLNTKV